MVSARARLSRPALSASRWPLTDIMGCLPIGVGLFDRVGRYVWSTGTLRRLFGPTVGSIDPGQIAQWKIYDADGRPVVPENWPSQRALRGERIVKGFTGVFIGERGREHHLRVTALPIENEDIGADGVTLLQYLDPQTGLGASLHEEAESCLVDALTRTLSAGPRDGHGFGAAHEAVRNGTEKNAHDAHDTHDGLTRRETEVVKFIAQGNSNKEIALELGISVKTVEFHRASALNKLQLRRRVDIVRYAIGRAWLRAEP